MVQINFARKEINCKIVYYGPGLSGKTTSLEVVHQKTPEKSKGELTSISTDGDRTLFFDFMPLDLGNIAGMQTKFHLYTVPGQVYYNSTRKLVLMGADGIIFVADSTPGRMEDNVQAFENLRQNLAEMGKDIDHTPLVIQYNKRDVPGATSLEEMAAALNPNDVPAFESSARTGEGVFQALKAVSAKVLEDINTSEKRIKRVAKKPAPSPTPEQQAQSTESGATPLRPSAPARQHADMAAQPAAAASKQGAAVMERPQTQKSAKQRGKGKKQQTRRNTPVEPIRVKASAATPEEQPVAPKAAMRRNRVLQKPRAMSASKIATFSVLGIVAGGITVAVAAKTLLDIDVVGPVVEKLQRMFGGK
jgi:hypothetical protein